MPPLHLIRKHDSRKSKYHESGIEYRDERGRVRMPLEATLAQRPQVAPRKGRKMTIRTGRLTYQPYLFAIALLTLLCKVAYSASKREQVFDSLLWAFAAIFVVSSILYLIEIRTAARKPIKSVSASIKTGNVNDSEVTGVAGSG